MKKLNWIAGSIAVACVLIAAGCSENKNSPDAVARITDMVPLKRWGKPREVADAVAFLVSEHAGYITGETLTVDGAAWLGRGTFGFL